MSASAPARRASFYLPPHARREENRLFVASALQNALFLAIELFLHDLNRKALRSDTGEAAREGGKKQDTGGGGEIHIYVHHAQNPHRAANIPAAA